MAQDAETHARPEFREDDEWLIDSRNNRASISYWGSREEAEKSLRSLTDCDNCINCSDCSDCSRCSYCSGCSDCSYCSGCSDCSRCSYCSRCSDCSYCSDCSDCSYCSRCSRCSDCSGCSGVNGEPITVPKIENIHQRVFDAVSAPDALEMGTWHTCDTTHCRAGWVTTLAGADGKALEKRFNTELAAMLIYRESGFFINPCRFYDSNADALEDMRKLAEQEAA